LFFDRLKRPFHKTFESQFKDRMEAFLSEKRALGYKYQSESYFLRYFDNFIVSKGYGETELTRQMVLEYSLRPETESMRTRRNKLSIVKLFGQYLVRTGENAYIYDEVLRDLKQVPYVFDSSETKAFFQALDSNKYRFHWGRYQYPVYFRVLYTTGMRESEVCCIKRADIDYEKHRLLVRDAKGQKDRYVYFSEPTCKMLICFDAKLEQFFPNRVYLFIGTACTPDSHVSNATVRHAFRKCWAAAGLPYDRANGISPCVHSFRHTYVLDRITQWQREGRNVDALLPYLSEQLGHKSLEETYRYCMRLDTRFSEIINPSQIAKDIIPEVSP
jgi:integrase